MCIRDSAVADKQGLFQAASGGTLFLDEVADLPIAMQVKLLRGIQEKAIRPIGSQEEIPVAARILSATHKDLAAEVEKGNFRQDLYYRINVIELAVPSLRERVDDLPQLVDHLLQRIASDYSVDIPIMSAEAMDTLINYPFPGNVRELQNILERAATLCENDVIMPDDLQLQGDAPASRVPSEVAEEAVADFTEDARPANTALPEDEELSLIHI